MWERAASSYLESATDVSQHAEDWWARAVKSGKPELVALVPAIRRLLAPRSGNAHLERVFKAAACRVLGSKMNKNLDLTRCTLLEFTAARLGLAGYLPMTEASLPGGEKDEGADEDAGLV